MAKFELKLRRRGITDAEVIADLKAVANALAATTVTKIEYDVRGQFGATTVIRKFGSWNNGLSAAKLTITNRVNIPDEELFENLANVWQRLGRQPVGSDLTKADNQSAFSLGTYEKRFASWNKALVSFVEYIENPNAAVPDRPDEQATSAGRRTPRKINWRLRATVLVRDSCICKMCGASPAKDPSVTLHVDHIMPWTKGGDTLVENLQTLCSVCNVGKSDELFG